MTKTHIQIEFAFVWIFRNFFISKRFCNIKSILQQLNEIDNYAKIWKNVKNTQSIQTYICLNVSQFFCIEIVSQLQKNWLIKYLKLHTMRKRRIRKICNNVYWFKQNSKNFNAKTKKCNKNIYTNQICFYFDISTFFVYEIFFLNFETNSSFSFESILKNSKINKKYTYKWIMFLFSHFRIFQLSLISSLNNQTIVNKFANFFKFFFRNRINQNEFFKWSIICNYIWNAFA